MFPLLIAFGVSVSVSLGMIFLPPEPFWFLGPFLGIVAFFPALAIITRRIGDKVAPLFQQAQRQAQQGNIDQAVASLEKARSYANWQLFLDRQINTQIGVLSYGAGLEDQAVKFLEKGYPKVSEGYLILGAVQYRRGDLAASRDTLERGIRFNKKSPILYNLLAWILDKEKQRDDAIAVLDRCVKAMPAEEESADNLQRLRNQKKMNMKPFGTLWYMLKFETPHGMVQGQPVRKGFRQPPKKNKGGKKRKR